MKIDNNQKKIFNISFESDEYKIIHAVLVETGLGIKPEYLIGVKQDEVDRSRHLLELFNNSKNNVLILSEVDIKIIKKLFVSLLNYFDLPDFQTRLGYPLEKVIDVLKEIFLIIEEIYRKNKSQ